MYNWTNILLKADSTISEAIKVLEEEALRIALVVDEENRLIGTVTDGDIRRALIQQERLDTHVSKIMYKKPTTAMAKDSREAVLAVMRKKDLLQIPIIDEKGYLVGLETLQQLLEPKKLDNPVFLMAGGFGSRLRPLTNDTPKPLLKVGEKPILEKIIIQFSEYGFYNIFISTHYKAEQVRRYFGNGSRWGVNIEYIHEENPLGTAGSLGLLPKEKINQSIIMMNGDILTKVNLHQLLEYHLEQNCCATMCLREYDLQVPYGVVEQDKNFVTGIIEKPVHRLFVNAGIYVLSPKIISRVEKNVYLDMPVFLEKQILNGEKISAFPIHEYWLDIGRMEEFERANRESGQ